MKLKLRASRLVRVFDAVSQFFNVLLLNGDPNESISGRAYREGWGTAERVINAVCFWEGQHCMKAHRLDVARAHDWATRYPNKD